MKQKLFYILALAAGLGFHSCDSLFDNELPKHDLVGDNAIVDQKSAETALNGVYSYLDDSRYLGGDLNTHLIIYNYIRLNMMRSTGNVSFEIDQLLPMTYDESDSKYDGLWEQAYLVVNAANNVIYYTEQVDDSKFSDNGKNEILGEARFMRAFANTLLLEHYAQFWDTSSPYGMVLRLEPSTLSNNSMPRTDVDSAYTVILNDLEFAIQNGPDFYSNYRGCKTTAKAFKANVLLMRGTQADREEALRLADEVIGSGDFALEETYGAIFQNKLTSTELMFTQYTDEPPTIDDNVQALLPLLGGGDYVPKQYMADDDMSQYYLIMDDEETERYKATLDSVIVNPGGTNPRPQLVINKFYSEEAVAMPMYYMRLAEVYLLKAEAMSYLDGYTISDVFDVLNVLRGRANETPFEASAYAGMEAVREEIFKEYIRELGFENGDAFFYAARTMVDGERLLRKYNVNFTNDNQLCFPIPSRELQYNYALEGQQNPY